MISKIGRLVLLGSFAFYGSNGPVLAGALEKYGSEPRVNVIVQPKVSSREAAINRAVRGINTAEPAERESLVAEYRQRANSAATAKRYDEANFYFEILRRSGN